MSIFTFVSLLARRVCAKFNHVRFFTRRTFHVNYCHFVQSFEISQRAKSTLTINLRHYRVFYHDHAGCFIQHYPNLAASHAGFI